MRRLMLIGRRSEMEPNNKTASKAQATTATKTAKAQPWKSHWPPKVVDKTAPYGFRKGEAIINSGN